jgi:hypothetical protein
LVISPDRVFHSRGITDTIESTSLPGEAPVVLKLASAVVLAAVATSCAPSQPGSTPGTTPAPGHTTTTTRSVQHWVMPNLVGSGLQDAQDAIQKLTGNVVFFTSSHDVTGQGRHQVLDRNWKVCDQNVAAGAQIQVGVKIDFGVVKLAEKCP